MSTDRRAEPYREFRPRFGLAVALIAGMVVVGGCIIVLFIANGPLGGGAGDKASIVAFALFTVWLLWRLGGVRARPDTAGLTVRNVIYTRRLVWAQIISVRFGSGDSWVQLDLADGSTLAVMGIQRADGRRSIAEAQRLAALVKVHGEAPAD